MRRGLAILVAAAAVLSACGGESAEGPAATLDVIETSADVRTGDASEFVSGEDGAALTLGDDVRTDPTGFAEIAYADGSLTRVDRDSLFRVVALGSPDVPDVTVELDAGRAWNRVQDLGEAGRFSVETSVGTAAVRGTAFDVDCAFGCLFRVFEGAVEVGSRSGDTVVLEPGEGVQVDADGSLGPVLALAPPDDDPWLVRNIALDEQAGFTSVSPPAGPDTAQAGIGGTWDVRFVSTAESDDPDAPPGSSSDVTFTIQPECASGPCGGVIDGGQAGTFDIVLVDGVHTIDDVEQTTTAECQPEPVFERRVTGQLHVSAVDGNEPEQAAVFVGTVREEFTALESAVAAGCAEAGVRTRVSEVRGVLQR